MRISASRIFACSCLLLSSASCQYAKDRSLDFLDQYNFSVGVGSGGGVRWQNAGLIETGLMFGAKPNAAALGWKYGRPRLSISPEAIEILARYPWPGNVRELRNLVERLIIMARGDNVDAEEVATLLESSPVKDSGLKLSLKLDAREGEDGLLKRLLEAAEREILEVELSRANWNVSQAARNLGIDRANLHRKMRRLGIARE